MIQMLLMVELDSDLASGMIAREPILDPHHETVPPSLNCLERP